MNWMSRFLIEALSAMVLVSFGGGFIPTASACGGDGCRSFTITGSGYTIKNSEKYNKLKVTGCSVPLKNGPTDDPKCAKDSKFETTISPNDSWTGPPVATGQGRVVLTATIWWVSEIIIEGCTREQRNSPRGLSCDQKLIQDPQPGHKYDHVLRCKGEVIECCLKDNDSYRQCEATVVYPGKVPNPPKVDVVCENLKPEKGVWTADLPFKQKPDKIHCTLAFTCGSPPADKLSKDEKKCTAVGGPAKTVTKEGNCVDKNCTSCDAVLVTPNDPCSVSFRGSKP
jgi:hypothetical protein